ncbi:RNA methyltransferase [Ferrovum sp.]|uniref:TrmH family RNA methyltransferase n=1 Tax=Ferrovum sp. TaxID=2609467 RepID=UPI002604E942|nr:RNA methyltransferase [Ferrovum sp.]
MKAVRSPALRLWGRLAESAHVRRRERQTVLEGVHLLQVYQAKGGIPLHWFIRASVAADPEVSALRRHSLWPEAAVLADDLFDEYSSLQSPGGVAALISWPAAPASLPTEESCLVLDGLQDPGNVGTLLRSAAAAGMPTVVCASGTVQVWSPKVLRAGMGAHFQLTLHEGADLRDWFPCYAGTILGAEREASRAYDDFDLTGTVALVIGNEGAGLTPDARKLLHERIHIPMATGVESLNAGVAGSILLFERQRQIRAGKRGRQEQQE